VGGGIPPRRFGDGGARHLSRRRVRNCVPRCNEPSRTDCGSLRPSYTERHWAGSTTKHRPRKVPRTAREATNYHAQKVRTVHATRGSRSRQGLGGWDPRSMSYSTFVEWIAQSPQLQYKRRFAGADVYRPRRLGDCGSRHRSHLGGGGGGGGKVSPGGTNQVGLTAGLFGLPTSQGIGPDQLPHTNREN
jgi:hypothetical protein